MVTKVSSPYTTDQHSHVYPPTVGIEPVLLVAPGVSCQKRVRSFRQFPLCWLVPAISRLLVLRLVLR